MVLAVWTQLGDEASAMSSTHSTECSSKQSSYFKVRKKEQPWGGRSCFWYIHGILALQPIKRALFLTQYQPVSQTWLEIGFPISMCWIGICTCCIWPTSKGKSEHSSSITLAVYYFIVVVIFIVIIFIIVVIIIICSTWGTLDQYELKQLSSVNQEWPSRGGPPLSQGQKKHFLPYQN